MKLFTPINQFCYDCKREVLKNARQNIVIDPNGLCWRQCESCIEKEKQRKVA